MVSKQQDSFIALHIGKGSRIKSPRQNLLDQNPPEKKKKKKKLASFFSSYVVLVVARFARVMIEDSSLNRFVLNGVQRDFFGGTFSRGIFSGGIISGYHVAGVDAPSCVPLLTPRIYSL